MSNELIFVLIFFWVVSAAYVMYYHNKHYTLGLDMVIGAILLGPILALIVGKDVEEKKKYYGVMEQESNDRHRRWFRTMGEINRERRPSWYRSIPPPPPISRVEPPNRRPDNKIKDFKFLSGNVKD